MSSEKTIILSISSLSDELIGTDLEIRGVITSKEDIRMNRERKFFNFEVSDNHGVMKVICLYPKERNIEITILHSSLEIGDIIIIHHGKVRFNDKGDLEIYAENDAIIEKINITPEQVESFGLDSPMVNEGQCSNVKEANDLKDTKKRIRVTGILHILPFSVNIYMGCPVCKKKAEQNCKNCSRNDLSTKVLSTFDIRDKSGSIRVVAYDDVCRKYFNIVNTDNEDVIREKIFTKRDQRVVAVIKKYQEAKYGIKNIVLSVAFKK